MNALEKINKFRNTPQPEWASERWIKLGCYIEPHLNDIEKALKAKQNNEILFEYDEEICINSCNSKEKKIELLKKLIDIIEKS